MKDRERLGSVEQVSSVLERYHESGVVNLDKSVREMLGPSNELAGLSRGSEVAAAVIAWDGYGLVIKSEVANPAELVNVARQLREAAERPG